MPRRYKNGLTLEGQRGRGFGTPVAADDAANKAYVDAVSDFSGFVANKWYLPVGHGQPVSGAATVANTLSLLYGYLKRRVTISALGTRVTTGVSGGLVQYGIYNHNPAIAGPSTLIASTDQLSASLGGVINGNLPSNVTLEMGGYWFACNQNVANLVFLAQSFTSPMHMTLVGDSSSALPGGTGNASQTTGYQTSANFGTLPTDLSAATLSGASLSRNPIMQFFVPSV